MKRKDQLFQIAYLTSHGGIRTLMLAMSLLWLDALGLGRRDFHSTVTSSAESTNVLCWHKPSIPNVRYSVAIGGKADIDRGVMNRRERPIAEVGQ
jgi:hypothetical protein